MPKVLKVTWRRCCQDWRQGYEAMDRRLYPSPSNGGVQFAPGRDQWYSDFFSGNPPWEEGVQTGFVPPGGEQSHTSQTSLLQK